MNSRDIEQAFGDLLISMEKDGSLWIDNPNRSVRINIWEHELIALTKFLQRPDVADHMAAVRATLEARDS